MILLRACVRIYVLEGLIFVDRLLGNNVCVYYNMTDETNTSTTNEIIITPPTLPKFYPKEDIDDYILILKNNCKITNELLKIAHPDIEFNCDESNNVNMISHPDYDDENDVCSDNKAIVNEPTPPVTRVNYEDCLNKKYNYDKYIYGLYKSTNLKSNYYWFIKRSEQPNFPKRPIEYKLSLEDGIKYFNAMIKATEDISNKSYVFSNNVPLHMGGKRSSRKQSKRKTKSTKRTKRRRGTRKRTNKKR